MNFVIGSRGRLGRAIVSSLKPNEVVALNRSVYSDWWRAGSVDAIAKFFERSASTASAVYVAAGIIDPKRPAAEHDQINLHLAKNIIEGATKAGLRTVTFGTVMERIVSDATSNPYFSSKIRLGKFVSEFASNNKQAMHIRIHTLYGGGPPDKFMFLGQMLNAIATRTTFNMSPGNQLREYHHIEDEVAAIFALVEARTSGVIDLSHGEPVTLKQLATFTFNQFKFPELLNIGALAEPSSDNYGTLFERPPQLLGSSFRDTLPSVFDYMRVCQTSYGEAQ